MRTWAAIVALLSEWLWFTILYEKGWTINEDSLPLQSSIR